MNTLKAEKRSRDVKAKRLRREGYVTGNLFGREMEGSILIKMDAGAVSRLLKTDNKGSQILLDVEGTVYDVLIKEVDYNPIAGRVDEMDFQALVSNEMVHSVAEIILENTDRLRSGVMQESLSEVAYKALPAALIDKIRVDVSGLKVGDVIRVKDLDIAKNPDIKLATDPETVVASVMMVHNVVPEDEAEETEEE